MVALGISLLGPQMTGKFCSGSPWEHFGGFLVLGGAFLFGHSRIQHGADQGQGSRSSLVGMMVAATLAWIAATVMVTIWSLFTYGVLLGMCWIVTSSDTPDCKGQVTPAPHSDSMTAHTETCSPPRNKAPWQGQSLWSFIGCAILSGALLSGSVIACLFAWCPLLAFFMGLHTSHPGQRAACKTRWCHLRRLRRDCRLRGRGALFLALLCSPAGAAGQGHIQHDFPEGEAHSSVPGKPHLGSLVDAALPLSLMQVSVSATIQHTPMLTTGLIPPASNLAELSPLEEVGSRPLTLREACQPRYVRQIAIFHGRLVSGPEPSVLQIDARLFRPALDTVVLQAFGLDARAAHLLSVHSALADLPTEQYVLQDATLPWNVHTIPVRVAASPGHTMSANLNRHSTCRDIVQGLAASLGYQRTPEADLCHCAPGWFVADSQPLLVPRCDTITWTPAARSHHQRPRLLDSNQRIDSAASQAPPSTGLACIVTDLGIIYAELDMHIGEPEQFRQWVRSFPELQPLIFRRLKYPLPDLPPFQYLATADGALGGHSLAVDLRALDLGIIVVDANRFSTCWQVLHQLTQLHSRILQPQALLQAVNEGDTLCFLHDLPVRPQVLLDLSPFDVLRLSPTRRRDPECLSEEDGCSVGGGEGSEARSAAQWPGTWLSSVPRTSLCPGVSAWFMA